MKYSTASERLASILGEDKEEIPEVATDPMKRIQMVASVKKQLKKERPELTDVEIDKLLLC